MADVIGREPLGIKPLVWHDAHKLDAQMEFPWVEELNFFFSELAEYDELVKQCLA